MRYIIIGDVHGCLSELKELVAGVDLSNDDHLVFAGDLVDKGPDSPGVVRYVRKLAETHRVTIVQGNHEINHRQYLAAVAAQSTYGTPIKIPQRKIDVIVPIQDALSVADREFLLSGPLYLQIPDLDVLVVHAGILPTTPPLPAWDDFDLLDKGQRSQIELHVTRGRFCTGEEQVTLKLKATVTRAQADYLGESFDWKHIPEGIEFFVEKSKTRAAGEFVSLGGESLSDVFWAEVYDGRFGHVYFGHQPFMRDDNPKFKFATGLDLGCVHGNRLSAVILQDGHEPRFKTVQARKRYAQAINTGWVPKVPLMTGDAA